MSHVVKPSTHTSGIRELPQQMLVEGVPESLAMSSDEGRKTNATRNTCTFNASVVKSEVSSASQLNQWPDGFGELCWTWVYFNAGKGGTSSVRFQQRLCGHNITIFYSCHYSWSSAACFIPASHHCVGFLIYCSDGSLAFDKCHACCGLWHSCCNDTFTSHSIRVFAVQDPTGQTMQPKSNISFAQKCFFPWKLWRLHGFATGKMTDRTKKNLFFEQIVSIDGKSEEERQTF